jgi:hypothetical protein
MALDSTVPTGSLGLKALDYAVWLHIYIGSFAKSMSEGRTQDIKK